MNARRKFKGIFRFICLLLLCSMLAVIGVHADESVLDNTGAAFLTIDPFPKTAAMGSSFTGIPGDISALFFNPSGLVLAESDVISSTHCEWLSGMRFENLAIAHSLEEKGALGINVKGFYTTGLEKRIADTPLSEGAFGAYFIDFGLTYSRQLFYFLPVGFSLKGIYEKIDEETTFGVALDLGVTYRTPIDGLNFGFSLKNLGSDMQFKNETFKLPNSLRAGVGYRTFGGNLLLSADMEKMGKYKTTVNIGSELIVLKTLFLRFGVNGETRVDVGPSSGLCTGVGFAVGDIKVDYAFVNYDFLGMTHRFGLSFTPGVTAPERKKIQKLAEDEARKSLLEKEKMMSSMYQKKGEAMIAEENYDEAINNLDIALVWDPSNAQGKDMLQKAKNLQKKKEEIDFLNQGKAAFDASNFLEAVSLFDRVLAVNPDNLDASELKKAAQANLEKESLSIAHKKSEQNENVQNLFKSAVREYSKGNYRAAISKWQKVVSVDPKREDAVVYIEKATMKINAKVVVLTKRLKSKVKSKDWVEVTITAKQVIALKPDDKYAAGTQKQAEEEIRKLINLNFEKAKEYYKKGNMFSSEEYFRIVLRYDPSNNEAKTYLKKIEKSGSKGDADKWYLKGIDAYTKNQYKLAISYWERCLSVDPGYTRAQKNIERARKKLIELGETE